VSVVQLRERDLEARMLADLAGALQRRIAGSATTLVINDGPTSRRRRAPVACTCAAMAGRFCRARG